MFRYTFLSIDATNRTSRARSLSVPYVQNQTNGSSKSIRVKSQKTNDNGPLIFDLRHISFFLIIVQFLLKISIEPEQI